MEKARVARLGQREFLMGFSLHLLEVEHHVFTKLQTTYKGKGGFF